MQCTELLVNEGDEKTNKSLTNWEELAMAEGRDGGRDGGGTGPPQLHQRSSASLLQNLHTGQIKVNRSRTKANSGPGHGLPDNAGRTRRIQIQGGWLDHTYVRDSGRVWLWAERQPNSKRISRALEEK